MVALVHTYYVVLRSAVRAQPELRRCLTRCWHCGIFFFTHPSNRGREHLRCPFGCREAHRKRQSNQRSAEYYRDGKGKEKKRAQNAKRRKTPAPAPVEPPAQATRPWPPPIVHYVRLVTSLIEGRPVSLAEVWEMLTRTLRQHRLDRMRRIDQTVAWLNEQPP